MHGFLLYIDCLHERKALWDMVIPFLRQYGDSLGLQVHLVDMHQGLDLRNAEDIKEEVLPFLMEENGLYLLALKEIQLSHELSSGPSFIVSCACYIQYKYIEMLICYCLFLDTSMSEVWP